MLVDCASGSDLFSKSNYLRMIVKDGFPVRGVIVMVACYYFLRQRSGDDLLSLARNGSGSKQLYFLFSVLMTLNDVLAAC